MARQKTSGNQKGANSDRIQNTRVPVSRGNSQNFPIAGIGASAGGLEAFTSFFIYDLGNRQWDIPQLRKILKEVLQKGSLFEGFRIEHDFPGIGLRVILLNARRVFDGVHATQSILLTLEDITGRSGPETFTQEKDARKGGASE